MVLNYQALYAFGNVLFLYWKIENNTKDTLERRCQNVNITFLLKVISEPRFLAPTLPTPTREHPHYISSNSRHISTFCPNDFHNLTVVAL